jgi:hypothetical protein
MSMVPLLRKEGQSSALQRLEGHILRRRPCLCLNAIAAWLLAPLHPTGNDEDGDDSDSDSDEEEDDMKDHR